MKHLVLPAILLVLFLTGCSPTRRLVRDLQTKPAYTDHFTGVALYDPTSGKYLIQHNADKPFTPASNTKLLSFYAGLLGLRDSLPVLQYAVRGDSLLFWGTGNPLLLNPDLTDTTALNFLRKRPEKLFFSTANYAGPRFGAGWAWDDYADDYSPELSPLPIYGNVVRFQKTPASSLRSSPRRFADSVTYSGSDKARGQVRRQEFSNQFIYSGDGSVLRQDVPFRWSAGMVAQLVSDTLHRPVGVVNRTVAPDARLLRGSPTDSLYKRMLYVSDNLFAEQILFLISAERNPMKLDAAGERKRLMDSVLHYPAASAKWADGSGLSRYNLFTPNIFIDLLTKIYEKVPQQRLFSLLPAAGQSGTIRSIGTANKPYIFAKSGSMSGVYNLSGYLLTQRGKLLYFSVMNNNFTQPVSEMRRRTGVLLKEIHEKM